MSRIYRSAQGNVVDVEKLRLANEEVIAVGNMKVNARGDQLGPGGKIVKTRNQIMKEYYQLNSPVSIPSKPEPVIIPETEMPISAAQSVPVMSEIDREMQSLEIFESESDDKPKSRQRK